MGAERFRQRLISLLEYRCPDCDPPNVGLPRDVQWRRNIVTTSIFETPVSRPDTRQSTFNLAGDQQSDLTVRRAGQGSVCLSIGALRLLARGASGFPLPWGAFGENFTSDGLSEDAIRIGDQLRIGTAEFVVSQPRMPCFRRGRPVRSPGHGEAGSIFRSGRSGFYAQENRRKAKRPATQ